MWERCMARIKVASRNFILTVTPLVHGYLIALVAFCFVVMPVALIICNLKLLRWFWLPIFLLYWLALSVVYWLIIRHREKREERFLYGDDLYFRLYPRDKIREERRLKRMARREELREELLAGSLFARDRRG